MREKLETTRYGKTVKFTIKYFNEAEGIPEDREYYLTANTYPDGRLGEIFIKAAHVDDAMADQWCRAISVLLQRGSDVNELVRLFSHTRFSPSGFTDHPTIHSCTSVVDFVVRWLELEFPVKS